MALNVTQVNQGFLALLGRPATGAEAAKFAGQLDAATLAQTLLTDASFKSQLSVETLSFKTVDLLNTDPAAFVESLYTALLGRASDAEGKAFWLSVAGITPNRADVVSQFIAAVKAQEGTADANAFATIQAEDKALASAWVESLYNNLAGRASDAEGLDFWTNAIVSFAMTPAQVAASFAAALALQGNTTEDGQNYLAKQGVADNFTASFKDFSTLITANEKAEALKNLVTMMNGVTKDSQPEQYDEEIKKVADEYQNFKAIQFTTRDDDNLGVDPETGEVNTTSGVNFTGTYNLTDPEKGTIQSSDSITGNEKYLTDTLTVNVTGYDKNTYDTFELNNLPSNSSVEKLIINNGAAAVTGNVSSDFEYINVNGTGSFSIAATTSNTNGFKDISLNSAATKEGEAGNYFSSNNQAVQSIKTGAGDDNLVLGAVSKSFDTGAGKDDVVAILNKGATGNLGAGDDKFTGSLVTKSSLNAGAGDDSLAITDVIAQAKFNKDGSLKTPTASIEIDGGTGTDTLDLSNAFGLFSTTGITQTGIDAINGDARGIKSIKNVEKIIVNDNNKLYASAVSGQKIELSAASGYNGKLTLDASGATTVDLSKFSNADGSEVAIVVENVKSGNVNLETGDKNFNAIKETIILTKDALKVNIKGFEKANDHIEIAGVRNSGTTIDTPDTPATSPKAEKLLADNMYAIDIKAKITNKTDINQTLINAGYYKLDGEKKVVDTGLQENDEFFIIAYDTSDVENKNSNAKVFKYKVGKDGSVGKVDQMASINVADKKVIDINEDVTTNADYKVTAESTVDGTGVATVTIDPAALGDASGVKVPLHTPVTSLNLGTAPIGTATAPLAIEVTGLKAKAGIDQVPVTIPNNSVISTLSFTDSTPVKVDTVGGGKTIKIDNIITGSGKDEIIADATKTKIINAGAGDDTIDLSANSPTTGGVTTVAGGAGMDALVIANKAAEKLVNMSSIEKIQIKGTEIAAKAINSNNGTLATNQKVELSNASGADSVPLDIKLDNTSGASNDAGVDLSKLVKADGSGDVTLSVTGVDSKDTITLSKEKVSAAKTDKGFVETVVLDAKATEVTVKNVFANDKLQITDLASFSGSITALDLSGSLTDKNVYFATSLNTSGIQAKLSEGQQVAVAVNANNSSTIYLVGKTGAAQKIATVDTIINGADEFSAGTITFKDGNTAGGDTANVLTFDNASGTITLAANGTYKNAKIDNTKTAISINGVDGAITLDGTKGSIAKVNIFATKADAVVTDTASIGSGNYNLYIGGSTTKADASVTTPGNIDGNAIILTSTQLTNAIAENVIINTTGKVSFADAAALNSHKLDLSKVGANVEITTAVKATSSKVAVSDFFKASSVSGDDSIKFIVDIASNNTVEATAGKDAISWNAGTIAAHKLDLTNDNAVDTVDLTGLKQGNSVDVSKLVTLENIGKATSAKDLLKVSATTVTVAKTDVSTKGSTLKDTLKNGIADNTANKAYLIIVNATGNTADNGTYLVYNSNADRSISENDIVVKLSGVYTNIVAGTDGFVTLA